VFLLFIFQKITGVVTLSLSTFSLSNLIEFSIIIHLLVFLWFINTLNTEMNNYIKIWRGVVSYKKKKKTIFPKSLFFHLLFFFFHIRLLAFEVYLHLLSTYSSNLADHSMGFSLRHCLSLFFQHQNWLVLSKL